MLSYHIECLEFCWGKKTRLCVRLIAQEMQWSICSIRESTANASQTSDSRQTRILLNIRAVQKRKASTAREMLPGWSCGRIRSWPLCPLLSEG